MEFAAIPIFWLLAIYGFITPKRHVLIYLFFALIPFGSFAVIPPFLTGGLNITGLPVVSIIIIGKTFFTRGGLDDFVNLALTKNNLLFLFLFWVVAVFTTLFMPRFFQGEIMIIPVRAETLSYSVPLGVTSGNLSQLFYISISVFTVFAFVSFLQGNQMRQHALKAIIIGASITVATGFLDYLNQYISINFLLEPFRNANYALLTDEKLFYGKRIVGLMPEASAYGSVTLGFLSLLYFSRRALESNILRDQVSPIIIVLLVAFVWLSTSSAAYVGLSFFGLIAIFEWIWRTKDMKNKLFKRGMLLEFSILNLAIILVLTAFLIKPDLFDPVIEIVDAMVFKKTESSSYEERSMWTAVSWQALIDSYGLGVGLGSTRASNGMVALISNVGVLGALFYYLFLIQFFIKNVSREDQYGEVLVSAAKWSFLPTFLVDFLIVPTPDFGAMNAFRYGMVVSVACIVSTKSQYKFRPT